ncbi:MAG TPA: Gfo/Idh/MocA family oxidoreductase [Tepidisphaeraceae bacterium]|nr:Gfo/Idh/MocA family oxidoreductase [Tepidisphaeraceae bacterium]
MDTVRFGVIGLGSIGSRHLSYLDKLPGARLAAVCDAHAPLAQKYGQERSVPAFASYQALLDSRSVDAIIIATPHFQHPQICLAAFAAGVHVLCEKPLAVSVKQARSVIAAHVAQPYLKFALMLQQRTWPIYAEMKKRLSSGELGPISRISWTITDWFRTDSYYASGGWRATWDGEGGGALLNQCPHNLDLLWWLTGMMPTRVTAVARIGASHPIEVEDDVSAILEYDGALGQFTTATGEAPGTNRLEIATDHGLLISEPSRVIFRRTEKSVSEVRQTGPANTRTVQTHDEVSQFPPEPKDAHKLITQNFVNAILHDEPLIAPGADGVRGLEIGNAILLAGLKRQPVDLPLDAEAYEHFLAALASKYPGLSEENPDVARAALSLTPSVHVPKKAGRKSTTAA